MKKFTNIFLLIVALTFIALFKPSFSLADCKMVSPEFVDRHSKDVEVTISNLDSEGKSQFASSGDYKVKLGDTGFMGPSIVFDAQLKDGNIVTKASFDQQISLGPSLHGVPDPNSLEVYSGGTKYCIVQIRVYESNCKLSITSSGGDNPFDTKSKVNVKILQLNDDNGSFDVEIKRNNNSGDRLDPVQRGISKSDLLSSGVTFGPFDGGNYYVNVMGGAFAQHPICENSPYVGAAYFTIGASGGSAGSATDNLNLDLGGLYSDAFDGPPTRTSCKPTDDSTLENPKYTCDTAIGNIQTSPAGIISKALSLVLGLAGIIAILLIIVAAYRLILSQGNAETIQAAREQLIAAILGLLFIIFSLVILQVIGWSILKIPGFG